MRDIQPTDLYVGVMLDISRRGFFTGLAGGGVLLAAPSIIRIPNLLMPIKAAPLELARVVKTDYLYSLQVSRGSKWVTWFATAVAPKGMFSYRAVPGDEAILEGGGRIEGMQIVEGRASLCWTDPKGRVRSVHAGSIDSRHRGTPIDLEA